MKAIGIGLLFMMIACDSFGQQAVWEILQGGFTFGFPKDKEGNVVSSDWERKPTTSYSIGSEIRANLWNNRLSPGVQFTFSDWKRFSSEGSYIDQYSFIYLAVCDYNFIKDNQRIIPYAGIGIGISQVRNGEWDYYTQNTHFAFSPRIGIEILKRLRLSAEYKYQGNRNNFFCLKAGFVIKLI